ncbi:MAG: CPBP family intramembrane metalloprotease, partial [Microcoleus sp. SIO2G3]|nr:CPBP family intramembrane metalloprotease [Microcoleus sp. SIO2G3]
FTILWLVGIVGVISIFWMQLPIPEAAELPSSAIKLLTLIQPTILLTLAVFAGVNLAHRVGLSAPLAEAKACSGSLGSAIKPQLVPGLIGGVAGGVILSSISLWWRSFLPSDFLMKAEDLARNTPFLTRILYGGVTEEILIRWGLMTLLVWVLWRLFQRGQWMPNVTCFAIAIAISSLIFWIGHLPIAFVLSTEVTASLVGYVIIGNSIFGLIAGYLYWKKGLEAAMIAHMLFHVIIVTTDYLRR